MTAIDSLKTQHEHLYKIAMFQKEKNSSSKPSIWFNFRVFGGELSRVYISNFSTVQRHGFEQKIISPLPWCLFPLGFQGSPPGAFCHHGTTAQRLKRWIVGRWVELSQGAGILGESEASFGIFFCGGNFQQRFTKKQQGTNKKLSNNRVFESWVDESMEISDGKCLLSKKLWQFKSAGFLNVCLVILLNRRETVHDILSTKIHQQKQVGTWDLRGISMLRVPSRPIVCRCKGASQGRCFCSRNKFMHCFNTEYHNASWGFVLHRELVSKDGLSFLVICYVCASIIFWLWSGKSIENLRGLDHPQYHCSVLTRWAN